MTTPTRNTTWIVASLVLLVGFAIPAFITGNDVWWSAFGIAMAVFAVLWWAILPAVKRSRTQDPL